MKRESELITVSSKGQVVIPLRLRQEVGITQNAKLLAYGKKDTIVLKKMKIPKIYKDWAEVFDIVERKKLKLTERDIQKEIEAYRKEKRMKMMLKLLKSKEKQ